MTSFFFFSKKPVTLTLSPMTWKSNFLDILSYPSFVWNYIKTINKWRPKSDDSFSKNSHSDHDLKPRPLKVELARDIVIRYIYVKILYNPLTSVGTRERTTFSKNSHSNLDLEPRTLKVNFARDIVIPNTCVKLYKDPSKNVGARAMTVFFFFLFFFFSKNSHSDLDLEPRAPKVKVARDIVIPNIRVKLH